MLAALDNRDKITGLILAGGEGRRMGGADKGLLDFHGRPLVAHVIERLVPQVDTLLISANRNLDEYLDFGYPVVTDASADRLGPLAGIAAGLQACETPWLLVCPCDCPALPTDLVARLIAGALAAQATLAARVSIAIGGVDLAATYAYGRQSLPAITSITGTFPAALQLCRRELLPALTAYLATGERRVAGWCRAQGAVEVAFADASAFNNLNTPADLAALPPER